MNKWIQTFRSSSLLVLGMVFGAIIYNIVWHNRFNELWTMNQDLRLQLQQAQEDNKTLQQLSGRQTVIKKIKITAEQASTEKIDPIDIKDIIQQLYADMEVLRGRDIFEIDSDSRLVRTLLNRKIYTVREKEYAVQIKTMLVMEHVLQIWIEVRPYIRS
ncbi:hypothetical protein OIN60_14040 [Paenibacillus sp. P96]|uniref:Sporulation membrane protein YtrI C-terminal domain-containing protein n=1 Tax=Paenibacillus zeirhizosphaerae TaxID=2987519 RepID=A0ABT9FT27_9BACL|nr:hypothetical protein [Paenibacillus sp. P96]MDP4097892.1 hypothetical protein [Paenibacillus sp. P96]